MAELLPLQYRENNFGIRAIPHQIGGENPIVFLTWWIIGLSLTKKINDRELLYAKKHIDLCGLPGGLYGPKNSHDNITYLLVLKKFLGLPIEVNLRKIHKEIGFWRIADLLFYGLFSNNILTRCISYILSPVILLQMLTSVLKQYKVRPAYIEHKRFLWWHKKKDLISEETHNNVIVKTWELKDGTIKTTRYMQNDGKHIVLFKLFILNNKLLNKIFSKLYKKRYGQNYIYKVLYTYFGTSHPSADVWKDYGDFLNAQKR